MDFAIGLVNSVINLPGGQVKFFEEFKLKVKAILGAGWNDVWASITGTVNDEWWIMNDSSVLGA